MTAHLFLFCGGPAIDIEGDPKPLMKIREGKTLIVFFLEHLKYSRKPMPTSITLLCDEGQESAFWAEVSDLNYPVPISVQPCGINASTFDKFESALASLLPGQEYVQFGYPDIFFFGEFVGPEERVESNVSAHISAATLTSRFPRLIVDVFDNEVRGISDYSSSVPANPLYVFGGDLWGRSSQLIQLAAEFRTKSLTPTPTLEYDFFFWLINQKKIGCVLLHGDRIWVDSNRDVRQLLAKTEAFL